MFWRMDLEYFGRGLLGPWPQADIGIVLWSLSVSAADWQTTDKLTRLCTIPEPATLTGTWDRSAFAMEAKILRPLLWFGLWSTVAKRSPTPGLRRGIVIARLRYSSACSSLMSKWSFRRGLATDEPIIFCCGPWYRHATRGRRAQALASLVRSELSA
jgi:hypothetical protein